MSEEYHRKNDDIVSRIEQKLSDHIDYQRAWNENHEKTSNEWRQSIDKRFTPLEDFVKNVGFSWKIVLGFMALVGSAWKLYEWFRAHVH